MHMQNHSGGPATSPVAFINHTSVHLCPAFLPRLTLLIRVVGSKIASHLSAVSPSLDSPPKSLLVETEAKPQKGLDRCLHFNRTVTWLQPRELREIPGEGTAVRAGTPPSPCTPEDFYLHLNTISLGRRAAWLTSRPLRIFGEESLL